ncbi:TolB family protein [Paenibacillus macquariensis]|uniref:Component of the Tol biopolymer transport system n=1 Tax=Paenibacillus macquariensis TaxID=948756 RepID=A0ABY1K416_9BACL|nr:transporter [Paenibacillus macquariensis]MEC0088928.1 transporter [Paenibacillus macquariensis]SIR22841.1 component of the Tol biopolymer transport system [Paenibacillus macquariensis]
MNTLKEISKIEDRNVISFLETVDVHTGKRIIVAQFDSLIEAPNWTRDGKRLIYNSLGRIYSFDIATKEVVVIDSDYAHHCNNDHVLSPDNSHIAVSHHTQEDGQSRIYIFPMEGGNPRLITPMAPSYLHGWSPDGKTLAYCAERNGQYDIYTIPVDGGVEVRLTDSPGLDDGPEYSPDGKYIWFNSVRTGLMQVWRMNADGSGPLQMTCDDSNNWFPYVSPDGETVAYISYQAGDVDPGDHPPNKNVEIRVMSSAGGEFRTLVQLFGGQGTLNVNSWSPDGKQLAFVSYQLKERNT